MRIVSLFPSATETLFYLGLWDAVVGITTFCTMPPQEVRAKTKVGGTKNPDIDRVESLQPDVVIVNSEENRKVDADEMQRRGLRLYVTHPKTVDDAIQMIDGFAKEFQAEDEGAQLHSQIRQSLGSVHPPRRYNSLVLVWNEPYMTVTRETYVDSVCRLFGFDNVIEEGSTPYPVISDDQIREYKPEAILLPDEPYAFRQKHADELRSHFPDVPAVKENRLLLFNGMYLTWHGYGTLRALREFPGDLKAAGVW
jgi:iron complex transport system substrate-binding protein